MSLEGKIFKVTFDYKYKLVNEWIKIIKSSPDEKRVAAFKMVVFKMMSGVVRKNICNSINLLTGLGKRDIPERDELVTECYILFCKCLEKYNIDKGNNFYFYYNKSISRYFFKIYQRESQLLTVELTEPISTSNHHLHDNSEPDIMEALLHHLNFDELDKSIIRSRLSGKKISEFLEENPEVTNAQYSKSMQKIKEILNYYKERGEL